jgi:tetratricopeptide (TPR) repeat protein
LWVNWGELLEMQGRKEAAATKYREALARPRTHDTYDHARQQAYRRLVALLVQRKDLSGAEAVYQQQLADFGAGNCFVADYARFMLEERGDTDKAIQLARDLLEHRCTDIHTREVLGMAHYVKWAGATGPDKASELNRAVIYFPVSPKLLYSLASSERTARAAKSLAVAGHSVDLKDNDGFTALAYAFNFRNHPAAARLLALGARGDAKIGPDQVPLGLMVVINGDVGGVGLLQRHGVDVARLEFRGMTALEYARRTGNRRMVEALESRRQAT